MTARYCTLCRREHPVPLCEVCGDELASGHVLLRVCDGCKRILRAAHIKPPPSALGYQVPGSEPPEMVLGSNDRRQSLNPVSVDAGGLYGAVRLGRVATFDPRGEQVYVLWAADREQPLYIGRSSSVITRLSQHWRDDIKRDQTERVQLIRCDDHQRALDTELALIKALDPVLNVLSKNGGS
jgi:predicted GIY-YIG superfamily endonuclease